MYPIVYQQLTNTILKDALLHYKKASFTPQKSTSYHTKGHLLLCQRPSVIFNLWIFITTLLMYFFLWQQNTGPLALIERYHLNDYFSIFLSLLSLYPLLQHINNKAFMRNVKSDSN